MRVAHVAKVTPQACGLYESTRELVVALRRQGVDSRIVDPSLDSNTLHPGGDSDRGAPLDTEEYVQTCDIVVNHSGLGTWEKYRKPQVLVAHGRPRSSFLSERDGGTAIYSYHYDKNQRDTFKGVVTNWPEHIPYHEVMFPDKPVWYVRPSCDLEYWSPGPTNYDWGGNGGTRNFVSVDAWRDDIDPFAAINAFILYARANPGSKLHLFAAGGANKPGWSALVKRLKEDGNLGQVYGWVKGLRQVLRAADGMITSQDINTRSIRETAATGTPIIRIPHGGDLRNWPSAFAQGLTEGSQREWAKREFNPANTADDMVKVLREALNVD